MCLMKQPAFTEPEFIDQKMTFTGNGLFTTFSGIQINPVDPDPGRINIKDIAHALSNVCRFGGHCNRFYSVAQHCVHVSHVCDPEDALAGLLHDASEAYLSDIVRPVKYQPAMASYREIEKNLEAAIAVQFGTACPMPASVKYADDAVLLSEAFVLFTPTPNWVMGGLAKYGRTEPVINITEFWTPAVAKAKFMMRYLELIGMTIVPVTQEELDQIDT